MREENSLMDGPASRRLPPLNALRAFEAAARHGSLVRAAAELHVTHGAVSRQVRQLEAHLGLALFERRNRAIFLTRQGSELLVACSEALARLAEAVARLRAPEADAPLVLSCEPTIAMRWLIPRLPAFHARFAGRQLHLLAAGGPVDFARDRIDVALRRNDFAWAADCHVERVGPELMGPVCQPALAAQLRPPQRGKAADAPRALHARTRPLAWKQWLAAHPAALRLGPPQHFEHFYLCLQAAGAGLGVALGSAYMVEDDCRDGRLAAPFGFAGDGSEYVLLSPTPIAADARRTALLDWLRDEMAQTRARMAEQGAAVALDRPGVAD
ncbi:MAG: LysR substrate-binding domain-containing protein [Comamonas sp.]